MHPDLGQNVEIYDKSDAQGFEPLEGKAGPESDDASDTP